MHRNVDPQTHDEQLRLAISEGDGDAVAWAVEAHQTAIYSYLRSRVFSTADAEDLCQEVFLRLMRMQPDLGRISELRPWLIGTATWSPSSTRSSTASAPAW